MAITCVTCVQVCVSVIGVMDVTNNSYCCAIAVTVTIAIIKQYCMCEVSYLLF